jgi:hypothetical protein
MVRASHRGPEAGLTLLEVLAVLLLLGLVTAAALPLLAVAEASYADAHRRQEMVRNAQVAVEFLGRYLRAAGTLYEVSDGRLRFDVGSPPVPVEFFLDDATGDLMFRGSSGEPASFLAGPFRSMQVACFDQAGDPVDCRADLPAVRQVDLRLTARDPDPGAGAPVSDLTVTVRVVLRRDR